MKGNMRRKVFCKFVDLVCCIGKLVCLVYQQKTVPGGGERRGMFIVSES